MIWTENLRFNLGTSTVLNELINVPDKVDLSKFAKCKQLAINVMSR